MQTLAARVLVLSLSFCAAARSNPPFPPLSSSADAANVIFQKTASTALVLVAVRGHDVFIRTFGETAPGSNRPPDANSVVRLCSITKVFTTDVLAQLVAEGKLHLSDPLQNFAPAGTRVPTRAVHGRVGPPITLLNLATHTAGLPREIGQPPPETPHFTYPDFVQRWAWLPRHRLLTPPGTTALYSNVGFDFLADALQSETQKPYPRLLADRILKPLGMRDTTFNPSADQCGRLLRGVKDEGPCTSTEGTEGSSGLYSTAADVSRWLRYLVGDPSVGAVQNAAAQNIYLLPAQLLSANDLTHAGRPTGIGLGWLRLAAAGTPSMILEKTGSGAGFRTYVALTPAEHTAIFIAFTPSPDPWHFDPFLAANNMLLALSSLPAIPEQPHIVTTRKRVHKRRVNLAQPRT